MSVFPLNIEEKEDSFEKLAEMANVPAKFKYTAEEFNKILAGLQELYETVIAPAETYMDNILRVKNISLAQVTPNPNELAMAASAINALPQFTWGLNEIYVFVRIVSTGMQTDPPTGEIGLFKQYYFIRNRAKGVYGAGAPVPVTSSDIVKAFTEVVASEVIDYGDIGSDEVWEYGTSQTAVIINPSTIFTAVQNSEPKMWVFIGESGLYGEGGNPFTGAMFFELSEDEPVISPAENLPPKLKDTDAFAIADSDLFRQLYCTSADTTITIPDAYSASVNQSLFFRVDFAGEGNHTIYDESVEATHTFKQGDFVLCEKKYGNNGWIVKVVGGGEPQVNSDWNAESGLAEILNKPTIPTVSLDEAYNGGRTIDADAGAVLINTDGIDVRGAISSGATVESVGGTITRMLFNPRKGALRAGGTNSDGYWNDAGLGQHSIGLGFNAFASGNHSVSIGKQNIVTVEDGVTIGALNVQTASGLTIGLQNTLDFNNSALIGRLNTNNFAEAIVLGISNVTNGYGAIALGLNNQPQSLYEIAIGSFGTIYSRTAANGFTWHDADRLLNIGNGQSTSSRSDAFTILKSGLAILPSVDNNKIAAGSGKSVVTKEYLEEKYPVEIKRVKVTIPANDFKNIGDSPPQIIPTPGGSRILKINNISMLLAYNSEPYNFSSSVNFYIQNLIVAQIGASVINNNGTIYREVALSGNSGNNVANFPLSLRTANNSNATTGDSPVTFIIDYTVHDFN